MRNPEFPPILPINSTRYTFDGDAAVEARIAHDQKLIGDAVFNLFKHRGFRALVLLGGYGRGEGGYCYHDGKPSPYNDYDYFAVMQNVSKTDLQKMQPELTKLAKELEHEVGVEVDFFFLREENLPQQPLSLMFAEMQWGHRVVAGEPNILKNLPVMQIEKLPLSEFTRLMLNRGSLLLLNRVAQKKNAVTSNQARERFVKYLFKAVLASGDAWLAAHQAYHPSYPEKLLRLRAIKEPELQALIPQYEMALEARFHPNYSQYLNCDLPVWQLEVTQMWLNAFRAIEINRLNVPFQTWADYAHSSVPKGQSLDGIVPQLRNLAIAYRDFGAAKILRHPSWSLRYPRERLISSLPLLLQEPASQAASPTVCDALGLDRNTSNLSAYASFLELWSRYS